MKKILLSLLPLLMVGCAARFTNLTPSTVQRSPNNLYQVDVKFASRQQTLRWETIQAYVVVGTNMYPMQLTQMMTNRWEALLYVPRHQNTVHYKYVFNFEYNAFGPRKKDSASSPTYTLKIVD